MMEDEEDNELDLSIPVKSLLEDITCPICLNFIEECSTLSCGHNFCHKCVSECINRNHKCPLCNKAALKENIYRNHQFEKIIKIIRIEKEKSKTIYYDNLIAGASNGKITTTTTSNTNKNNNDNNNNNDKLLNVNEDNSNSSPVEQLFKKYLKSSLISFESHYQDLSKPYNENVKKINSQMQENIDRVSGNTSTASMSEILIDQIRKEYQIKQDKLKADFKISTNYLLSSLEDYLKKAAVPPSFINIYTSIIIPERDIIFDHCSFKPTSCLSDIRATLVEKLNSRGDKFQFVSFNDDSHFVALKPASMLIDGSDSNEIKLIDELKPLYFYQIPQGSKIQLRGGIQLKGDIPKECFKKLYVPNQNMTMDYYRCEDCKVNWICKNCSEFCHKGHKIVSYILNHKPTYACCYDEKYKCCKLIK
ncbi:hypothetical protein ACTFIU_007254 [Dictyostelium citrinum]